MKRITLSEDSHFIRFILFVTIISLMFSCNKDKLLREAKVETKVISEITATTAKATGDIIDLGQGISDYGHCWDLSGNPTIKNSKTSLGSAVSTGIFTSELQNLQPGWPYHVRAYAKSGDGIVYGSDSLFTTLNGLAVLTTAEVSNITIASATCGGNVISANGDVILTRGICWDTQSNVSLTDKIGYTENGSGLGQFTGELTGLTPGMIYFVKAYAITNIKTTYGELKTFTTLNGVPVLTTSTISAFEGNSAVSGGNISNDGGASITTRGICWSTTQNPTIVNDKTINGSGTGSFAGTLTSLEEGQIYYARAYATNSVTTSYGNEISFNSGRIIGSTYAGGLVFYNNGNGHGFVCAEADQSSHAPWGCYGATFNIQTFTAINTGTANTNAIVAKCTELDIAARICYDLVLNTYSDWFLPSKDELNLMYVNLHIRGFGGFTGYSYLSSSLYSADYAWEQIFTDGVQNNVIRNYPIHVRAARVF